MTRRVLDKVRSLGLADTMWFIVDSVLRRASFGSAMLIKYYFVAQPVSQASSKVQSAAGRVRIYVTDAPDEVIAQSGRSSATIQSRFNQRSRCVVAERDGRLAGFIWLCPDRYHEDEVRSVFAWTPGPVACWDYDVYIAPPFRMGRLFLRMWERAHLLLAAEGVGWTLSRIDAFNAGSLAAHRKLGARDLARGWFLFLGRVQIMFSSVSPYLHISPRDANVPRLQFDLLPLCADSDAGERDRVDV